MARKTITMNFKGYWRYENKGGLPGVSGVYCVYECTYNTKLITINKLIYIGESENVKDRIANHEKSKDWLSKVGTGNQLCFSFGGVTTIDRGRVEAAMIFKHKPPLNDEYSDSFPFDRTTMELTGETGLLDTNFTVDQT